MLKRIPKILSPELVRTLMEMGHGDELVIGDGNFPSAACAKRLVRCDGIGIPELLDAILELLPLDSYVECPVALMSVDEGDKTPAPIIWDKYKIIVKKNELTANKIEYINRSAFYERAKEAYAIAATSESAVYANIILKKGIVS